METKLFPTLHTLSLFAFLSLCQLAASVSFMLWSCVPLFLCRYFQGIPRPALQICLVAVLFVCSFSVQLYLLFCNVHMYVQCISVQHSIRLNSVCRTALAVSLHAQVCYKPTGDIHISIPSKWSYYICVTGIICQYITEFASVCRNVMYVCTYRSLWGFTCLYSHSSRQLQTRVVGVYLNICVLTLKHFAQFTIYHMQVSVCIAFDELG